MDWCIMRKIVALFAALLMPFVFVSVADAAPKPPIGTLVLNNFPTEFVLSPDVVHGTVDWTYSKDVTKGGSNVHVAGFCYHGEKIANPTTNTQGRDFVTANTNYLNTGYYGTTSGTIPMRLWGWTDADGRVYAMSTRWDTHPGDAWCYVVMADWGTGSWRTYTEPTVITVSEQWFVNDPRVP